MEIRSDGRDKTLSELVEPFAFHPKRITQWNAQRLERATDVFATAAERKERLSNLTT